MTQQPSSPLCRLHWLSILFVGLIVAFAILAWNARDRILQGNSDFISYYTAARIVQSGQSGSLYNLELQKENQEAVLDSIGSQFRFLDGLLAYNHPPFEVLFFVPLAWLRYLNAFFVWGVISVICVGLSVGVLCRADSQRPANADVPCYVLGAFAFLPVWVTLVQGQDSATTLLFLTLAFHSFKRSSDVRAGLWLSLILQRFQFLPLILAVLLFKKRWRALAGFAVGAVLILLASLYVTGISGLKEYGHLLVEMTNWINRKGIYPSQMHCLRGQAYALWYPAHPLLANVATAVATLVLIGVLLVGWLGPWQPGRTRFDLQFALLVVVSLVASPHLNFHDLSLLLLPSILIVRNSMRENLSVPFKRLKVGALVLCYPVTLAALIVSGWGPIRLSVWGMLSTIALLLSALQQSEDLI
ncbi:MAG: DUF2029 domain-containing protein [Acidobacteria bacterium]|nr:DUF2029 domain-containing protein [Acidobacteriota bacterium]MCI0718494.1 DUF2029 domain-containing protein [Acidobacteriota bacterium]